MNQEQRIAYPPIPNSFIKVEPEEPQLEKAQEEFENQRRQLIAYPPLPYGVVKKELGTRDGHDESSSGIQGCQLIAYPPLPQGVIKEELDSRDGHNQCSFEIQLVPYQEVNVATDASCIINPSVSSFTSGNVNDTERQRAIKRKNKTVKNMASIVDVTQNEGYGALQDCQSTEIRTTRTLQRYLKRSSTAMAEDGNSSGNRKEEKWDLMDVNMREAEEEQVAENGGKMNAQSLDGVDSNKDVSDDNKIGQSLSSVGPSQRKQKTDKKASAKNYHLQNREPIRPFKCSNCERSYKRHWDLTRHLTHDCGVEPKFRCKECGRHFKLKSGFKRHILSVHKIDRSQLAAHGIEPKVRPVLPFKCGKCKRTYKTKDSLTVHLKNECGVVPAFPCTLCDYRTAHKSNLRSHLIYLHNVDRSEFVHFEAAAPVTRPVLPFKCDQCGRIFKAKASLVRHLTSKCGVETVDSPLSYT